LPFYQIVAAGAGTEVWVLQNDQTTYIQDQEFISFLQNKDYN